MTNESRPNSSPPGWYQDPTGQSEGRYWNGTSWTQMSNSQGTIVNLPIDPSIAQVEPVPGTQVQPPTPPTPPAGGSSSSGSGGLIIALVVGLLLVLAVFVAIDGDGTGDPTPGGGTAPAGDAPAGTQPPADE
jgi:hypothetical protein